MGGRRWEGGSAGLGVPPVCTPQSQRAWNGAVGMGGGRRQAAGSGASAAPPSWLF